MQGSQNVTYKINYPMYHDVFIWQQLSVGIGPNIKIEKVSHVPNYLNSTHASKYISSWLIRLDLLAICTTCNRRQLFAFKKTVLCIVARNNEDANKTFISLLDCI